MILTAASGAALLLVAAAGKSLWPADAGTARAVGRMSGADGFAALVALMVFAAAMAEYLMHGRQTYLYVAVGFFAASMMDAWSALVPAGGMGKPGADIAVWYAGRITLAALLMCGAIAWRARTSRQYVRTRAAVFSTGAILWAAVVIFSASVFPLGSIAGTAAGLRSVAAMSAILFAVAWIGYSRTSIHRSSALLAWMSYGLVFAVFAQLAALLSHVGWDGGEARTLFGFANLMKTLGYVAPLAGLLAGHTRLQRRLQRRSAELQSLIEMQRVASSVDDPDELYRRVVDLMPPLFESDAACLMPYDKGRNLLESAAATGLDEDAARNLVFRAGDGPVGKALATKELAFVPDAGTDDSLAPKLGDAGRGRFAVCVPLVVPTQSGQEVLGVLVVLFKRLTPAGKHKPARNLFRRLEAFASQAALAIDKVQMRTGMHESLRAQELRSRELETVWRIGQALASELELHALVDTLVDELKKAVSAQACSVLMYEPDTDRLKIMGHRKLRRYDQVADHVDDCDAMAAMAAERDEPMAVANVPNTLRCKYPEIAVDDGGTHHMLSVPMESKGQAIGAISVFRLHGDPFGEAEIRLLTMLGKVVAAGIRNAELYEREKRIAESLEASFAPDLTQELSGIEAAGLYKAGLDECSVGGDFFDIVELGEGRYGIAVGDVAGKGLDAAVYTAMAKHMIKAYSAEDPEPVSVVSRLNRALYRHTPEGKFITLVYGVLNVNNGEFVYVNAGHEPPFLHKKADETLTCLKTTGPAAGAIPDVEYASDVVPFGPGDVLVFYTDGATEARSEGKFLGTEGLEKIVARHIRANPRDLPEAIYSSVREYAKGRLRDDVVILCIKSAAAPPGQLF